MNNELLRIIYKLKDYEKVGYMDKYEIQQLIKELNQINSLANNESFTKMMEDVTEYMIMLSDNEYVFKDYVTHNIHLVSEILKKSERTIYRKIQNNSFTLVEKQQIIRKMENNAED